MSVRILVGDCLDRLRDLPDGSVHCCVTSPPYWGLRDYGEDDQLGLEETPDEYVAKMVEVFREVRRVLRDDGTLWLNLGDSYASQGGAHGWRDDNQTGVGARRLHLDGAGDKSARIAPSGLKPKDLVGIPWRVAFALQADGWWLRQDIIWQKPSPMPESVRDRCTKAHEYIFLLSKSARYFYDADAIAEDVSEDMAERAKRGHTRGNGRRDVSRNDAATLVAGPILGGTRNRRSVWSITTKPFSEAHFATFPPDLPELCIKAATSEHGVCGECGAPWERATTTGWAPTCECGADPRPATVIDPFGGAGTTGLVADRLKRDAILIELNPDYAKMAERRIYGDAPMFVDVTLDVA